MKDSVITEHVYDGHNSLLLKPGEKLGKIVPSKTILRHHKSQFYLQGMTVPRRAQPIDQPTQRIVNQAHSVCENPPIVHMPHYEDDLPEFGGGDRREEGSVSGTRPTHSQFQLLELPKVGDRYCVPGLNVRELGKGAALMRVRGKVTHDEFRQ